MKFSVFNDVPKEQEKEVTFAPKIDESGNLVLYAVMPNGEAVASGNILEISTVTGKLSRIGLVNPRLGLALTADHMIDQVR